MRKERGITLVALIVTIIILIILSMIAINSIIGEHGLINMAMEGTVRTRIAEYEDGLYQIGVDIMAEHINGYQYDKPKGRAYLEEFQEKVNTSEMFKDKKSAEILGKEEGEDEEKLRIVTREGYVFDVTENGAKYVGMIGEEGFEPLPEMKEGSITIELDEKGWTNKPIHATITLSEELASLTGLTIQYTKDSTAQTGWTNYKSGDNIEITTNGVIIVRVKNKIGDVSKTATEEISNIDTIEPEIPKIVCQGTAGDNNYYKSNVTATITAGQDSDSGADKIKYTVNGSQSIEETTTNSGTITIPIEITQDGSSTITAYTIDKAGNESEPITQIINKDTELPTINLTQANTEAREYTKLINVDISDTISGVSMKKYANREQNTQYFSQNGINLENSFTAKTADSETETNILPSGVYTVYAKDMAGNETCKTIEVKNLLINSKITALNGIVHRKWDNSGPCEFDEQTGRLTLINARTYGPYWELPLGTYELTYVGENLQNCIYASHTTYPSEINHTCTIKSKSSTKVVVEVKLLPILSDDPTYAGRVEFDMSNTSNSAVYLDYIIIKELP